MLKRMREVASGNGPAAPIHQPRYSVPDNPITPQTLAEWTATDSHHAYASLHEVLCDIRDALTELARLAHRKDTLQIPITIGGTTAGNSGSPYHLATHGYRHSRVFVGANVTVTLSDPAGATLALTAGWNLLDLRDGCELTAANNTNALLELTDELVVR